MHAATLQDGVAVPLNTYASAPTNPATGDKEIWNNFMGAPSVYFVFAVPQDGITAPADFNASVSSYLRSLWNGKATGTMSMSRAWFETNFLSRAFSANVVPVSSGSSMGGTSRSVSRSTGTPACEAW